MDRFGTSHTLLCSLSSKQVIIETRARRPRSVRATNREEEHVRFAENGSRRLLLLSQHRTVRAIKGAFLTTASSSHLNSISHANRLKLRTDSSRIRSSVRGGSVRRCLCTTSSIRSDSSFIYLFIFTN